MNRLKTFLLVFLIILANTGIAVSHSNNHNHHNSWHRFSDEYSWHDYHHNHHNHDDDEEKETMPTPTITITPSPTITYTATPTPIPTPQPTHSQIQYAGVRSSEYGIQDDSTYLIETANKMSSKFPDASPAVIYVIGYIEGSPEGSRTYLSFPHSPVNNVDFSSTDNNEELLNAYDDAGIKVILQVEPADADVPTLINIVLNQYKHHPSVAGFGIDIEWLNALSHPGGGRKTTDSEIKSWLSAVQSINPNYKLIIKHWDYNWLGSGNIPNVVYLTDSEQMGSYNNAIDEYTAWAEHFSGSEIGYQIGYPSDKSWWKPLPDPTLSLMSAVTDSVPDSDIYAVYWVDFSLKTEFP